MFKKITSAVLVAAVLASGTAAFAVPNMGTEVDVGFITEVNEADRTVTLNGETYDVPYGMGLGLYNIGQKVSVSFVTYGETKKASTIVFSN